MTALLFALIAALGNVMGGLAAVKAQKLGLRIISGFVAFGAGFMLAVAFVEMAPEAVEIGGPSAAWYVLAGYLLVHLTQHTATQHFHFGEETHDVSHEAGVTALIGLLMHTFFDGVAIASGFSVRPALGVLVFLAIVLHKIPEGLTISSLQLAGGTRPSRAVASSALLGGATVAGVLLHDGVAFLTTHGLAISAGVTIYVAASNLVPEFQSKRRWELPISFFLGALAFWIASELLAVVGVG